MGELPDFGKLRRRFGSDEECDLRLRQRNLNHRGKQRENEKRLGGRDSLLFSPVTPVFNRTAPVAFTILRGWKALNPRSSNS